MLPTKKKGLRSVSSNLKFVEIAMPKTSGNINMLFDINIF